MPKGMQYEGSHLKAIKQTGYNSKKKNVTAKRTGNLPVKPGSW